METIKPETNCSEIPNGSDDTISRQMAIDALENIDCSDGIGISALKCDVVEDAINTINALPPAQPERKRGKWIYGEDEYGIDGYHCDKCGFFVLWDYAHNFINYIEDYNFCPNCGAKMGGSE